SIGSNADFRVYAKYSDYDNTVLTDGSDADDAWHMGQGGFRVHVSLPSDRVTWQGDVYGNSNETAQGRGRMSGVNTLGRWTHTLQNGSETRLQVYYDHTHLDDPFAPYVINNIVLAPAGVLQDALDTYDVDFQHHANLLQRHQIVWGLGYRHTHDVVNNIAAAAFYPPQLDQNLYSGFVQDEVSLNKKVSVTIGTKLEHNDYTGFELEPSVHLQWNIDPQNMMWSAVSRAVRSPSRIDRDLSQPAAGIVVLKGSSDFVSETVVAYEAGYRAQAGSRLMTSLATYYNDYQHVRSTSITTATLIPFYFANNLKGYTYGAEISGTYQAAEWWRVRFGYNYLSEHLRVAPDQFDLSNAQNETADPEHQAMLNSMFDLPHQLQLDATLRWVDKLVINNGPVLGTVPDYFEMDLRMGWHVTNTLDFSLTGHNLLHAHHPEYGFPGPARIEATRGVIGKLVWRL
ncbi:MAG: TonB-dependent receptor, partial [Steroidobacter sp.]